jgi:hypothetical protein
VLPFDHLGVRLQLVGQPLHLVLQRGDDGVALADEPVQPACIKHVEVAMYIRYKNLYTHRNVYDLLLYASKYNHMYTK